MDKILVTGGAGYIGSHTVLELLKAGFDVVVVDNLSNSSEESLVRVRELTGKEISFYKLDVLDAEGLSQVFREEPIGAVIHFAALKAVGESVAHPLRYYQNNVTGTLTLCEVMKTQEVKDIVFSSSATVYGETEQMPLREDFPLLPATNPYGRTKQMMEDILRDLARSDEEWNVAILRYFNPIGADESGRIGEDPNGVPNNLLPYISQVAVGRLPYLRVWGNDYPTPDGTPIRDYIHVTDLALGHIKALEKLATKPGLVTYNLGTGRGYSVLEVLTAFERACGKEIPYRILERRPGDLPVSYAATDKAERELEWVAKRDIDKMCADAWRWQSQNLNGYE